MPLLDVRQPNRPTYDCPKCRRRMLWSGTAFRPPPRADDEAWQVAERVMSAGVRYLTTSKRQRFPRKLAEVDAWLAQRRTRDWLPERAVSVAKKIDGAATARVGGRLLAEGDDVLLLYRGRWQLGTIRRGGDGQKLVVPFVTLTKTGRRVPLEEGARLRLAPRRG